MIGLRNYRFENLSSKSVMFSKKLRFLLMSAVEVGAANAEGTLGDFEKEIEKSKSDSKSSSRSRSRSRSYDSSRTSYGNDSAESEAGARFLDGDRNTTVFSGGFSFGVHPVDWFGFEGDLRWSPVGERILGDDRGGILLRAPQFPHLGARGGYRAITLGGEVLHGPELGIALT